MLFFVLLMYCYFLHVPKYFLLLQILQFHWQHFRSAYAGILAIRGAIFRFLPTWVERCTDRVTVCVPYRANLTLIEILLPTWCKIAKTVIFTKY